MKHAARFSFPLSLPLISRPQRMLRTALAALLLAAFGSAQADAYGDVNALLRGGQAAQALAQADAYIQKNPRDPQMRFLRGVILSEQGKTAEAATTFTQLTRDYPELPEPYNNLAALYATQGDYEKAREALETALRLNPNYGTAHENLGDIYARLAAQHYARAANFASAGRGVQPKLDHVRQLFDGGLAKAPGAAPNAVPAAAPAASPAPVTRPVRSPALPAPSSGDGP